MMMFTSNQLLHGFASCLQELLEVNVLSVRDSRKKITFFLHGVSSAHGEA